MLIIRPATSAESQDLARIGLASWEKAIRLWGEDANRLRAAAQNAYFSYCTQSWPFIVTAELNGQPVGWASVEKSDDKITDLWVHPDFQNRGIGTRLLAELEEQIKARNYPSVHIETHARNAGAISLYKRLGYRVISYFVSYDASLDEDLDKVEMLKEFHTTDKPETQSEAGDEDGLYDV